MIFLSFLVLVILVVLAVLLVAALVRWRRNVKAHREARLDQLKRSLRAVDAALDTYVPCDAVGESLIEQVRNQLLNYYATSNDSTRKRVKAGELARQNIRLTLWRTRPYMLAPEDVTTDVFIRAAQDALRDNGKEVST